MPEEQTTTPPAAPAGDTSTKGAAPSDTRKEWETIVEGKYKTEAELAKAYKDLEKKLGEQGEELKQGREFVTVVQPLLETIREDPELFKQLDERLRKKGQPSSDQPKGDGKTAPQDDVRGVTRDLIIEKFEEKYGIDKLSADEKKALRTKIGTAVTENTGVGLTDVDLRRLPIALENAYILANKDKLVEKSKLEALLAAQDVNNAGIPSMPSSQGAKEETLTPEEKRVAARMGLTNEQYLDGKKKSGR